MKKAKKEFQVGDIVRYTGKFMRSVGLVSSPVNGKVIATSDMCGRQVVGVLWSDDSEPANTLALNLEFDRRYRR